MLACLVCTKTVDDGVDVPHDVDTKSFTKNAARHPITIQLKQMASRLSAGALYRHCRPCAPSLSAHDLSNCDPVVHPSKDDAVTEEFPLKSYNSSISTPGTSMDIATKPVDSSSVVEDCPQNVISPLKKEFGNIVTGDDVTTIRSPDLPPNIVDSEWVAQVEPGVYITFLSLPDGSNDLKRIRFSRHMFSKQHAEAWWTQNCSMVRELYIVRSTDASADEEKFSSGYATPDAYSTRSPRSTLSAGALDGEKCPRDFQLVKKASAPVVDQGLEEKAENGECLQTSNNEWIEQDEPGVYLTIMDVPGVGKQLKRVRFSREKFSEGEAKAWWDQNSKRVCAHYLSTVNSFDDK